MNNLQSKYQKELMQKLMEELNIKNEWALPRMSKIVVNFGLGEALENANALEKTVENIREMTGQHPVIARAKKAIANFKIKEGDKIGCYVTLRGDRMWNFFDRLVNIALPRVKDFRGLSTKSFDAAGNYSLGLKEQTVFPEVDGTKIDKLRGFEISIVIENSDKDKSKKYLTSLGMPFEKSNENK